MSDASPFSTPSRRQACEVSTWGALSAVLLSAVCALAAAQPPSVAGASAPAASQSAGRFHPISLSVSRRQQVRSEHAVTYYSAAWGVQDLAVRSTASGNLIRFSYKVLDPARARQLFDKGSQPVLFSQRSHALLQIPVMEKVGPLRQANDLAAGKEYWMAFSNKGNLVRPGDRVNVIIGAFHADGLLVE
jgi:hypothetical protein